MTTDAVERTRWIIEESIEVSRETAEQSAPAIAEAAASLAHCVLEGHKIIACGNGGSASLAQYFCSCMLHHFERERPGLPALASCVDATTLTAIAETQHYHDAHARQVRALGQPGDVLLAIARSDDSASIALAMEAAHDRDMRVILLGGDQHAELLRPEDIGIRVPSRGAARMQEAQLLAVHCLCDLIDRQLLGQEM